MKKSKSPVDIHDISLSVYESVKSGKLVNDYPDLLKECKKLGISSYILQVLIKKAQTAIKGSEDFGHIDYTLFIQNEIEKKTKKVDSKIVEKIVYKEKLVKRKVWPFWLIIILLFIICVFSFISIVGFVDEVNTYQLLIENTSQNIDEIKKNCSKYNFSDSEFEDWSSTNTTNNSKSKNIYSFYVLDDDIISFDYKASTESGYDFLNVYIKDSDGKLETLVHTSGLQTASKQYTFKRSGFSQMIVEYTKDGSYNRNQDKVWVKNIKLKHSEQTLVLRDLYNQLENLHKKLTPYCSQEQNDTVIQEPIDTTIIIDSVANSIND